MKIKGFLSTCLLSLFLSGSISNAEILVGYAAPSLDGAQAQIQNGFLVGAEKNGWKVLSVTSGGDALYMHCLPADIGVQLSWIFFNCKFLF